MRIPILVIGTILVSGCQNRPSNKIENITLNLQIESDGKSLHSTPNILLTCSENDAIFLNKKMHLYIDDFEIISGEGSQIPALLMAQGRGRETSSSQNTQPLVLNTEGGELQIRVPSPGGPYWRLRRGTRCAFNIRAFVSMPNEKLRFIDFTPRINVEFGLQDGDIKVSAEATSSIDQKAR